MSALLTAMDVEQVFGWWDERALALSRGEPYRASIVGFPKGD